MFFFIIIIISDKETQNELLMTKVVLTKPHSLNILNIYLIIFILHSIFVL